MTNHSLRSTLLEEIEAASRKVVGSTLDMSGSIRVAAATTFGRLHILPLIPELLATFPGLEMDLVLSDAMRDMISGTSPL